MEARILVEGAAPTIVPEARGSGLFDSTQHDRERRSETLLSETFTAKGDIRMSANSIDAAVLTRAALALFDEAYRGPSNANGTWFIDNEPEGGFLGVLSSIDAATASRPLREGDPATVASHAGHLRFALALANRAARGENPYDSADWSDSWLEHGVDEASWAELVSSLREEYRSFREVISSEDAWKDESLLTGTFGQIAHGAWHLGAIRQGLGLVATPRRD